MAKSRSNIWNYGSTETSNIGTILHHLMGPASRAAKFRSTQHKLFNIAQNSGKIYNSKCAFYENRSMTGGNHVII